MQVADPEITPDAKSGDTPSRPTAMDRAKPWFELVGIFVAIFAAAFVFRELRPDLLFSDTTPNGGDTGAHIWWPAELRSQALAHGRIAGWTPDWYGGFPVGQFYFPLPALAVLLLDLIFPYNVAFKLVTVSGVVGLPLAAYVFARGMGARWPAPPLFSIAMVLFLFGPKYQNFGGNMVSQLQGEFSFSIGLALGLAFLGVLARALDEKRSLALPAALLAATLMSHIIVSVFVVVGAGVLLIERDTKRNGPRIVLVGAIGGLLTAAWSLPLVARLAYTTDMGWQKEPWRRLFFNINPTDHTYDYDVRWAVALAVMATVIGIVFVRRSTIRIFAITVLFGGAFAWMPEGRLWNGRVVSFWFVGLMLLAATAVAEVIRGLEALIRGARTGSIGGWKRASADSTSTAEANTTTTIDSIADVHVSTPWYLRGPAGVFSTVAVIACLFGAIWYSTANRAFLPSWVKWNYSGYEAKDKPAAAEYRQLLDTARTLPPGRLLWERLNGINSYGSDFALMLLPYFTNGRIGSMEGLYFESAGSTPYHFMTVAELAKEPSNPVRGLPYRSMATDFALGVRHLQLLGVRYYMAGSVEAKAAADANPDLRFVKETEPPNLVPLVAAWRIYEVRNAPLVEALRFEPVVLDGVQPVDWRDPAAAWFNDPNALDRPLVSGGPKEWKRHDKEQAQTAKKRPLPPVRVTKIKSDDHSISFQVDRIGVPVVVKTSYFPNWKASGAKGPWRATPNLMVVVPTERTVTIEYGRTGVDIAGMGLSLLGVGGIVGLVIVARRRPTESVAASPSPTQPATAPPPPMEV